MGKRWRATPRQGLLSCPVHGKTVYRSEGAALTAAREVEVRERLEPGAMSYYACTESKGWHIGHRSIRDRINRSR